LRLDLGLEGPDETELVSLSHACLVSLSTASKLQVILAPSAVATVVLLETPDALPTSLPLDPALVLLLGVAGGDAINSIPCDERQAWRRWGVCHNERRRVSSHSVDCSQRILYVFLVGVGKCGIHAFKPLVNVTVTCPDCHDEDKGLLVVFFL